MESVCREVCSCGEEAASEDLLLRGFHSGGMRGFQPPAQREKPISVGAADYTSNECVRQPIRCGASRHLPLVYQLSRVGLQVRQHLGMGLIAFSDAHSSSRHARKQDIPSFNLHAFLGRLVTQCCFLWSKRPTGEMQFEAPWPFFRPCLG